MTHFLIAAAAATVVGTMGERMRAKNGPIKNAIIFVHSFDRESIEPTIRLLSLGCAGLWVLGKRGNRLSCIGFVEFDNFFCVCVCVSLCPFFCLRL